MPTMTIARSAQALGSTFTGGRTATADNAVVTEVTLAAAKVGALTTRTSDTAGTLTMDSGHGFTDGQKIDIYWDGGAVTTATIGTVATNSVPFTGATGVLPADETAITAMVQHVESFNVIDGDLVAVAIGASVAACCVSFLDGSAAVVGVVKVSPATGGTAPLHYIWDDESGADIPISADAAQVALTHGDSANSRTVTVIALAD